MKIALIDADSLCFYNAKENIKESIYSIDEVINNIISITEATHINILLSSTPYFRHKINSDYKGNRKQAPPQFTNTLKAYLRAKWGGFNFCDVEADDMVGYLQLNYGKDNTIICSPDKDVLKQISGTHYDYYHKEFITVTEEEAKYFLWQQVLMGDSGDNIKGIPGIGEVKARKILDKNDDKIIYITVLGTYIEYYKSPIRGLYEFQKNLRQIYLLRTVEDFLMEIGTIPTIPVPLQVKEERNNDQTW